VGRCGTDSSNREKNFRVSWKAGNSVTTRVTISNSRRTTLHGIQHRPTVLFTYMGLVSITRGSGFRELKASNPLRTVPILDSRHLECVEFWPLSSWTPTSHSPFTARVFQECGHADMPPYTCLTSHGKPHVVVQRFEIHSLRHFIPQCSWFPFATSTTTFLVQLDKNMYVFRWQSHTSGEDEGNFSHPWLKSYHTEKYFKQNHLMLTVRSGIS
jgi:hypothetical protein